MKRILLALLAIGLFASAAHAARVETYYLKGFGLKGRTQLTCPSCTAYLNADTVKTDSIPHSSTFTSPFIPIHGAAQVVLDFQGATGDSDSVVVVQVAGMDTTAATTLTVTTSAPASFSGGAVAFSAATGVVSCAPGAMRQVYVMGASSSTASLPYIPASWVKFAIVARNILNQSSQSIRSARVRVLVYYPDDDIKSPAYKGLW